MLFAEVVTVCPGIVRQHCCIVVVIKCGDCRSAFELHVLTVTCYAIDEPLRLCADCIPHIYSPLEICCFGLICGCVVHIDGHLVISFLDLTVRSYSVSVMAASMNTSSLFVLAYFYLSSLSFLFF